MICTGEPEESRTERLNEVLEENTKNKAAQEAHEKLHEAIKKQEELNSFMKKTILKHDFDMNSVHAELFYLALTEALSEKDVDYLLNNEKDIIEDLRSEMSPKELTRDCLIKAIVEIGGACVKNGELSEESFNVLKESLGIKTKKTRKDFNGLPFFKTCIEQFVHRGGDTSRKIILKDEIINPDEIIPDNGTVFSIRVGNGRGSIITYGKDYEEITVVENLGNDDIIRGVEK